MTAPSMFYRQHRAVEAPQIDARHFRPVWRVKTPLDRLLRDKAIGVHEYEAACRFRESSERAFGGLLRSAPLLRMPCGAAEPRNRVLKDLDDIRKLRAIVVALGELAYLLLDAVIVQEIGWTELGEQFRIDPRTARSWTIISIKALAAFMS